MIGLRLKTWAIAYREGVDVPLDLVFVEGWMLGFTPIEDVLLSDPSLRVINDLLRSYAAWHSLLDGFI
jgi:pantothenate kinase-related protein Tda10